MHTKPSRFRQSVEQIWHIAVYELAPLARAHVLAEDTLPRFLDSKQERFPPHHPWLGTSSHTLSFTFPLWWQWPSSCLFKLFSNSILHLLSAFSKRHQTLGVSYFTPRFPIICPLYSYYFFSNVKCLFMLPPIGNAILPTVIMLVNYILNIQWIFTVHFVKL